MDWRRGTGARKKILENVLALLPVQNVVVNRSCLVNIVKFGK